MADAAAAVNDLANAYRAVLRAGDQQLAHDRVQRQILQAVVADSASRAELWVKTRVDNGTEVAKPLAELTPELAKGDIVGQGLQQVRDEAVKQAKGAVTSVATTAALPVWVTSVVTFLAGVFGFAQEAGAAFGAVAIPAVLAGGPIIYVIIRALAVSPQLAEAAGGAAGSALDSAGAIGSSAQALLEQHAGPAVAGLAALGYQEPVVSPVLSQLRGGAKTILVTAYVFLGLCVVFFCFGIADAYSAYQQQQAGCQFRLSDGTCIGG